MEKASVSASYETRCLNDYRPLMLMKFVKNHLLRFGQSQLSSVQFSFRCDRKFSQNGGEIAASHCVCVCGWVCTPHSPFPRAFLSSCSTPFYGIDMSCRPSLCPPSPTWPTLRGTSPPCEIRQAGACAAITSFPLPLHGILLGLFLDMHFGGALASVSVSVSVRLFRFIPFAFVFALLTLLSLLPVRRVDVVVAFICFVVVRILY